MQISFDVRKKNKIKINEVQLTVASGQIQAAFVQTSIRSRRYIRNFSYAKAFGSETWVNFIQKIIADRKMISWNSLVSNFFVEMQLN